MTDTPNKMLYEFAELDIKLFNSVPEIEDAIKKEIIQTEVVLDIGPGIYPSNFFVPKFQVLIEPCDEYVQILKTRFEDAKDVLVLNSDALTIAKAISDLSVDSIFLLDVIEHLEKDDGIELITELKRIVREQIVVFTPLGFMPQHVEIDRRDRWGLSGGDFQEHKSGWLPSDFGIDWKFLICENFHLVDADDQRLERPFGAFYALFQKNSEVTPSAIYDQTFFKETPKDAEISKLKSSLLRFSIEIQKHEEEIESLQQEILSIKESTSWKITEPIRNFADFLRKFRVKKCHY